jgi:hypothetical protein
MNIKDPTKRRSKNIPFRVTEAENDLLDKEAEKRDVNKCDVVREALMKQDFMAPARENT